MLTRHDIGERWAAALRAGQHGYCRVGAGGVADLRLVCSGWMPIPSPAPRGSPGGR